MLLYKLRSFENPERVADILKNGRLYCAEWYKLNDVFEGRYMSISRFAGNHRRFLTQSDVDDMYPSEDGVWRVCSLSARITSTTLWGHYASGGRGLAIGLDFSDRMHRLTAVEYSDEMLTFDSDSATHLLGIKQLLARKTVAWSYEAEYRIITPEHYFEMPGRIARVVLGPKCSMADEDFVRQNLPSGAILSRARLNHRDNTIVA